MSSLGANITIPDQVVLVGGTGRHLSDRFAVVAENLDRYGTRMNNGYNSPPKNIQDRLGPRRFTGSDYNLQDDLLYSMQPSRQHVLKRLGQPTNNYSPWQSYDNGMQTGMANGGNAYGSDHGGNAYGNERSSYGTYNPGQVGRGRGRRRWFGYGGYRGGYNRYYTPYSYYNNNSYSPYSSYYGSYSKPRFGNYTKYYGSSYSSFRSRGTYGGNRYNRGRRGRLTRNAGRPQLTQEDLDRELDEYRSGNAATKREDRSGDVNMS